MEIVEVMVVVSIAVEITKNKGTGSVMTSSFFQERRKGEHREDEKGLQ